MSADTLSSTARGTEKITPSASVAIDDILVAQDLTAFSRRALQSGLSIASRFGGRIHHVHVAGPGEEDREESRSLQSRLEDELNEVLGASSEGTEAGTGFEEVEVIHEVLPNEDPAGTIVNHAYDRDIDLVVVGTHGRRGLRRLLLGSVAEEILHRAPCPVLAVRESALTPPIERVLTPVDFSEHSMRALRYGREIAGRFGAEIDLLHVLKDLPTSPTFYGDNTDSLYYDYDPDIEDRVRDRLRQLWDSVGGPETDHAEHASLGSPPSAITDLAEERAAELIVMGTRGQTGIERLLLGSVAERVLRTAGLPVLIVRPKRAAPRSPVPPHEEVPESD